MCILKRKIERLNRVISWALVLVNSLLHGSHRFIYRIKLTRSPTLVKTCPLFFNAHVQNTPSIRHFWRHIDAIWQVSPALLTFRRHLPVTKADVLLTLCTYKVLYAKKAGGKNSRGNLLGGVLMATMRCVWRHARGHQHQRCRHGVGLLVDYLFCVYIERAI